MALTQPVIQAEVEAVAGELAGAALTVDQWTLALLRANNEVTESAFGNAYRANMAGRYFAAHVGVKLKAAAAPGFGAGAAAGPVSSVTVGAVSKTYDTSGASMATWSQQSEELRSTAYGREFLRLVRLWAPHAFVV